MSTLRGTRTGRSIPHCEVVSRPLNLQLGVTPSGVARLRWNAHGRECTHDVHLWLRLDELLTPGTKFRVELQARAKATFDLPLFTAHRDFVFTGNTKTATDVAVGVGGVYGWVYGVVVVGAQPLHDTNVVDGTDVGGGTDGTDTDDDDDSAAGWGVVHGGVPPHVLRDLFKDSFPDLDPSA